jgi:hypothetical protein
MKTFLSILSVIVCSVYMSSCYYDKADLLYGGGVPCTDSVGTVSYTQKIVPMFQQQCYSCHSGGSPSGGIAMGTYATDKAIAINGKLYGSVAHAAGYKAMPQGAPKMTSCQIATIKKWIDGGSLNN